MRLRLQQPQPRDFERDSHLQEFLEGWFDIRCDLGTTGVDGLAFFVARRDVAMHSEHMISDLSVSVLFNIVRHNE